MPPGYHPNHPIGEDHGMSKLNDDAVRVIRETDGCGAPSLASPTCTWSSRPYELTCFVSLRGLAEVQSARFHWYR